MSEGIKDLEQTRSSKSNKIKT